MQKFVISLKNIDFDSCYRNLFVDAIPFQIHVTDRSSASNTYLVEALLGAQGPMNEPFLRGAGRLRQGHRFTSKSSLTRRSSFLVCFCVPSQRNASAMLYVRIVHVAQPYVRHVVCFTGSVVCVAQAQLARDLSADHRHEVSRSAWYAC